ncbi:hypothetical protein SD70_05880 [Gordoniibacillus kamchatkensis]|uniref:DNA-binding response regulator n=1 Tax=Gordoniibacillus kamchatkensis TaxID=1590651 RepID=A0ABR5AL03_9BACL|nr:response regulator [Paenibacillus sp. VKM B-2647]KIL41645.1 hypothetical protein SD70_05880 [Paenibacillus sp. VKM B-2647]
MYKVLIVEDEWLVREGLKTTMDWEELGCRLLGEACDGETALQMMEEEAPDILLTDIRMPGMDGIQLAAETAGRYPHVKIVFLTGFDDFVYAQQAIRLGAADYVLKPTNFEELTRLIRQLTAKLDEERRLSAEKERMELRLTVGQPLMLETMLYDLLLDHAGTMEKELFREYVAEIGEALGEFRIALLHTEPLRAERKVSAELRQSVAARCSAVSSFPPVRIHEGKFAILLHRHAGRGELQPVLEKLVHDAGGEAAEERFALAVSAAHLSLDALPEAFDQAASTLYRSLLWGTERLAWFEDKEAQPAHSDPLQFSLEEFVELVKWGTEEAIREKTQLCWSLIAQKYPDQEWEAGKALLGCIVSLYGRLLSEDELRPIVQETDLLTATAERPDRLEQWLDRLYESLIAWNRRYQEQAGQQSKNGFEDIEAYVREHYAEDITLQSMAQRCNMSESYFSRLFKKQIGTSFVDYLTALRMRRAKELLANPRLKIYEVSLQVGYQDSRYFSQIFRKSAGETPTEFRKRLGIPNYPL